MSLPAVDFLFSFPCPAFLEGPLSRLPPQVQVQLRRALNRVPDLVDKLPLPAVQFLTEKVRLPCLTQRHLRATQQAQSNTAHLHQQELSGRSSGSSGVYAARGLTVAQALRTRQFWLLWLMAAACATAGLNTAVVYKQFASTSAALTGDEYQALVGGIGALLNGLGRVSWGGLSDRIGFKAAFAVLSVLQAAAMLTYTTSAQSKVL